MSLKSKLISAAFGKLQAAVTKFKAFLKKPAVLTALKLAGLAALLPVAAYLKKLLEKKISQMDKSSDPALSQIKDPSNITEEDVNNYVKNNRDLQKFLDYVGKDFNNTLTSDIVAVCGDPNANEDQMNALMKTMGDQDLSAEDFLKIAEDQSDMDYKVDSYRISKDLSDLLMKMNSILPWVFMVYMLILKIKEFLTQNEYPSVYRGKYIQRLIRTISAVLKQRIRQEGQAAKGIKSATVGLAKDELNQINTILKTLKKLDSIIVGSLLASFVYLRNRKILQRESLLAFQEIASTQSCISAPIMLTDEETTPTSSIALGPSDVVNIAALLNCPVSPDNYIVPHEPIEDKLLNLSCEVVLNPDVSINESSTSNEDLATKALFENKTDKTFKILVSTNDTIDVRTPFAVYDGVNIFPIVNGIVEKTEPNKIYVKDIIDPPGDDLGTIISEMNDKFKEYTDTKAFLRDFYIPSYYPVMLKSAPGIDSSLNAASMKKIIYTKGGIIARWDVIMDDYKAQIKDWQKRTNTIAGKDNVKTKCDQENVEAIKTELDVSDDTLFKSLIADAGKGIAQTKVTALDSKELIMIEYYFNLLNELTSYYDQSSTVIIALVKQVEEFLINRYFIDKYSLAKVVEKVNVYTKELSQGTYFETYPNFYNVLKTKYLEKKVQPNQAFSDGESYLKSLSLKNTKLSEEQITSLIGLILFLFNFSLTVQDLAKKSFSPKLTRIQATQNEGIWLEGFFNNLWKRYNALPSEIDRAIANLDALNQVFESYSIINIDEEEYRWYTIDEESCEAPDEEDPYLSPKTKMKYSDKKYWLRYCAFATLASVVNPATSWSTGFPPPIGPIPFPTVYIPIKAFQMKWGMIVMGLTITGIYPFPWILFVNWSTQNHVPLADPVTIIQREVDALKKELTKQIKSFKKITIKNYMDKVKADVDNANADLEQLAIDKSNHKIVKPKRDRTIKPVKDIPRYLDDMYKWETNGAALAERTLTAKRAKNVAQTKYKILRDAYDGAKLKKGNADAKLQSMERSEEVLVSQFDRLDILVNKIDDILAPLPINTKPETANFAFTLKNPKPIINIAQDLDQTIAQGPLDKVMDKFELKNADLMKTNYGSVINKSFNNYKVYKKTLSASMTTLIQKDPFPKYENLKPTNLPYMAFLLKSWAPKGAQTYGFPGFTPPPVG